MSTGIESYENIDQLGAIYPMAGSEVILVIIGILFWLGCHIWRIVTEKHEHDEIIKCANKKKNL